MATIEDKIGYTFKNREYLMEALTHSSFANERHNKIKCNERMEFLGDAVLSIISANFLYHRFPDMPEGDLSKLRSSLVCTQSLSDFARQISLGDYLFLGRLYVRYHKACVCAVRAFKYLHGFVVPFFVVLFN